MDLTFSMKPRIMKQEDKWTDVKIVRVIMNVTKYCITRCKQVFTYILINIFNIPNFFLHYYDLFTTTGIITLQTTICCLLCQPFWPWTLHTCCVLLKMTYDKVVSGYEVDLFFMLKKIFFSFYSFLFDLIAIYKISCLITTKML